MAQMTPFELFGLKPAFKVDLEALHAAHERAILQVHPDRFADRPAAERRVAEQWASRINEAYAVLKDPVKRAVWLCEAAGRSVGAETNTRMPMDFLMQQMAWREAMDDACGDDEKNAVRDEARGAADKVLEALSSAIDETHDWDKAVDLTRRLMFIERFLEQNAQ